MVDVGRDDGPAPGDLVAHEFRRDEVRDGGAEILAVGAPLGCPFGGAGAAEILPVRHVEHLLRDDAGAGEFELGDGLAGPAGQDLAGGRAGRHQFVGRDIAVVLRPDAAPRHGGEAPPGEPRTAHRGQARRQIDPGLGVGIGSGRVVEPGRRLAGALCQCHLAEWNRDVGPPGWARMELA